MNDLRAWEVTCCGITVTVFARSKGRAHMFTARRAAEAGFAESVGHALKQTRSKRAPWHDVLAACRCDEGFKPCIP